MCEVQKSIQEVNKAANKLISASLAYIAAGAQRPLQLELEEAFPTSTSIVPNDMLAQLGKLKEK